MISEEQIARAAELLRAGRLVAFPTETVYGLGANALDAAAVDRIFQAKGRPATSPLIVHVDSIQMARGLVTEWPDAADRLCAKFWPGPLTLVLPKQHHVPDRVTGGLATVGVRMPSHPIALALIRATGLPIAAPSANLFTQLSPTSAEHVRESMPGLDLILDGGPSDVGIESTVVSLAGVRAVLLRPGMISRSQIEDVIGPIDVVQTSNGAHPSPGMHDRHYRPRTPLIFGPPPAEGSGAYLFRLVEIRRPLLKPVRMPVDAAAYGARLYETLHSLDGEGLSFIAVEPVPDNPEWAGISDRLRRAATRDSSS
jgi:L-threonylcarbamoyladenylate synthase